ncbi:hypothetical protein PAT3040_02708 [Paenibacillus agaridevorans]|uniref:Glycosyltransferase 2-like domain-containing protein n=1 Tax=Paenibacillus agaridevorans TaxID=171404 RepID=A0A2R5EN94_9BACL|nr:glycosyltransferase family 2 protein [Paenibacillus agaridevorans]GBG08140.1 hypothetical protein PAT3040_02708 [Paenibacillus agaridevorans]
MKKKVSIVIPTYKRNSSVIKNAINSVLKQTYKNIEIIVVDDNGSENDLSREISDGVKEYPQVLYIAHEQNMGACKARNTGIEHSSGEFVAFLDDDDSWDERKLEKQIRKFENSKVGLVYCGIKYIYEKKGGNIERRAIKANNPCKELLIKNYIGSTSCGIVRRTCAIEVGMFDVNLKSGQDLDFWYRLAEKYEIDCVEECLLNYTIYENNTITSNYSNRLSSNIYLKEKYMNVLLEDKELMTIYNLKIAKAYLKLKMYNKTVIHIINSISKMEISLLHVIKLLSQRKLA